MLILYQRVRDKELLKCEDFYYEKVAQKLHGTFGSELDTHISNLRLSNNIEENVHEVLLTHQILTQQLKVITELDKRSLASKYLHFHVPKCFFIYDSRAIAPPIKPCRN